MNITIEHGIKDREHPFTLVSRELIEDKSISMQLRFLIIYCLSKPSSWVFQVRQLCEALSISKDTLYKIVKEGVEQKYILRSIIRERGKIVEYRHRFFETKNQIMFPVTEKPELVKPDMVKPDTVNLTLSNTYLLSDTESLREIENTLSGQPAKVAKESSPEVERVRAFLLKNIQKTNAAFEIKDVKKWDKDIDLLLRVDKRTVEEVEAVIAWACSDSFWKANMISPASLRKNFDKLKMKVIAELDSAREKENYLYAKGMQNKHRQNMKGVFVEQKYVACPELSKEISYSLPKEAFRSQFIALVESMNAR